LNRTSRWKQGKFGVLHRNEPIVVRLEEQSTPPPVLELLNVLVEGVWGFRSIGLGSFHAEGLQQVALAVRDIVPGALLGTLPFTEVVGQVSVVQCVLLWRSSKRCEAKPGTDRQMDEQGLHALAHGSNLILMFKAIGAFRADFGDWPRGAARGGSKDILNTVVGHIQNLLATDTSTIVVAFLQDDGLERDGRVGDTRAWFGVTLNV